MADISLIKVAFCTLLAIGSVLFATYARERSWEQKALRASVTAIIPIRFVLCLGIYILWPEMNARSDAVQVYLPETLKLISGELPYRDFVTSYSPLFSALLAIPVMIWQSVGSIVLTMLVVETVMIILYLKRSRLSDPVDGWRVAFLYLFSPISFYWIGLVGYNGSIIALFAMLGLILAERGKHALSGVACGLGLLCSKLLAALSWPAVILYDRRNWLMRSVPVAITLILLLALTAAGFDTLMPIKKEFGRYTEGNLLFVISLVHPGLAGSTFGNIFALLAFVILFSFFAFRFVTTRAAANVNRFNTSSAFIALISLLFMTVSTKTYSFYLPMMLIFLIHALVTRLRYSGRFLAPLAILGSITTIETGSYLTQAADDTGGSLQLPKTIVFVLLNLITIACYVYMMIESYRAATDTEE
ncbi:MAG: hypothetical protein ABIK83_08735 [Candidatus Zixiibacteriota bacterium]